MSGGAVGGGAAFLCTPADLGSPWGPVCIGCGGLATASDDGKGSPPFEAPEGSRVPGLYCSEECWADWEDFIIREDEARAAQLALCPECGFDNQEHDIGCSKAPT